MFGKVEFGTNETVGELAGFDIERLNAASNLLFAAMVRHFKNTTSSAVDWAVNHDHQMRSPCERKCLGRGGAELNPGEVDPGCGTGNLAEIDLIDKKGGDNLHTSGP